MKLALVALLAHPLFILGGVAVFAATPWGLGHAQQSRQPRLYRNRLRVQFGRGQQRLRLRGTWRQHAPMEHRDGRDHASRPLHSHHRAAGDRRFDGGQATTPESAGHVPNRHAARSASFWPERCLSSGRLLFLPLAVLGPIAEHLSACLASKAESIEGSPQDEKLCRS